MLLKQKVNIIKITCEKDTIVECCLVELEVEVNL